MITAHIDKGRRHVQLSVLYAIFKKKLQKTTINTRRIKSPTRPWQLFVCISPALTVSMTEPRGIRTSTEVNDDNDETMMGLDRRPEYKQVEDEGVGAIDTEEKIGKKKIQRAEKKKARLKRMARGASAHGSPPPPPLESPPPSTPTTPTPGHGNITCRVGSLSPLPNGSPPPGYCNNPRRVELRGLPAFRIHLFFPSGPRSDLNKREDRSHLGK